jgi:hypothetical protein
MFGIADGERPEVRVSNAHDPQRSVAIDREVASRTAVLFVGRISLFRVLDRIQPVAKLATEPIKTFG